MRFRKGIGQLSATMKSIKRRKRFSRGFVAVISVIVLSLLGLASACTTVIRRDEPLPDQKYFFHKTMSREVLENYLSRAVTHAGLCAGSLYHAV